MKYLKQLSGRIVLSAIVVGLATLSINAQFRTAGDVVDVIDGKTVLLSVPTGIVTVELQYIDVPEDGQPLHTSMKDHLKTLLAGKSVELQTKGFSREKITGKIVLNGVDVSQQMIRDGAAWHMQFERSGQSKAEFAAYAESESLAKLEKRGVWSVNGLEPAWEFREKKKAIARQSGDSPVAVAYNRPVAKRKGYWSDENPRLKNPAGMTHGFNAATQTGFLGTSMMGVKDVEKQAPGQKMAVDMTYYYTENPKKGRTGYFVLTVISAAEETRFLKSNALSVEVDGKKIIVGKPKKRDAETNEFKHMERLSYNLDVATIAKIANGGKVIVSVGDYHINPTSGLQMILYNMLQAAK